MKQTHCILINCHYSIKKVMKNECNNIGAKLELDVHILGYYLLYENTKIIFVSLYKNTFLNGN